MIKINLLPVREAKRQAGIRRQGILLGIAAGVGVAISISLNMAVEAKTSAKQAEISTANQELAKLKKTREEVERYRVEKEEIERKLNVIARLQKNRSGPVRVLDELASRIPERMWLEKLSFEGSTMNISGVSIDAEIVAEFLTRLSDSDFIDSVELDGTTVAQTNGLMLNKFSVRCRIATGGEQQVPAAAAKR